MLFKVNPSKQNIQTEQGALVVTGSRYVQLHAPQREGGKCLSQTESKTKMVAILGGKI